MKKFILFLTFLVLVLVPVTNVIAAVGEKGVIELDFWSWRTEDIKAYQKFISEFNKEYPNIHINFTAYRNTEYNTILATALQGGMGPDIIQLRAYGGMEPLANAGFLLPLDDKIPELENFPEYVLEGATSRRDGKIYGVHFAVQHVLVLYNKRLFNELHLETPKTWEEFLNTAEKIKNAGYIPFANGTKDAWTLETLFGGVAPTFYGGDEFYEAVVSGEKTFESEEMKRALEKILELRPYLPRNYTGVGYTDMQIMFAQEMAVMWVAGSYEIGTIKQMNPAVEIGAFIVPGETEDTPAYSSIYVDGSYGINADCKYIEEATKFIRFTASQKFGQMFTDELAQISAVPGVEPTDKALREVVNVANPTPFMMLTAFRYGEPSGSTLLQNELQALMAGTQNIETTLRKIQQGIATWYEPFKK